MQSAANAPLPDCLVCGEPLHSGATLSLGSLMVCNQFEKKAHAVARAHALAMTECAACHLVQLSKYPPADVVRPSVPWIRYNEPFVHLDAVVEQMQAFLPSTQGHMAAGVGPFDAPLLERLAQCGLATHPLDLSACLPRVPGRYPYLESIQALLRPESLAELASVQGRAKLVSCRYLLEHSHDPVASLKGLGHLMTPDGLLFIEIPDSSKFFSARDYSFIWEEHICYFSEESFSECAQRAGYEIVQFNRCPGALEDALVFVLRVANSESRPTPEKPKRGNTQVFLNYQAGFAEVRQRYLDAVQAIAAAGRKVAIFGAGHQSIMFVNALGLAPHIAYAIDDAPEKLGYLLPGTSIPIVSSEILQIDPSIDVCLLGVGPSGAERVRNSNAAYLARGGRMYTIFPGAGGAALVDDEVEAT